MREESQKGIAILGSTGSIGTQALDIISQYPEKFKTTVLTANRNWELLVKQALYFHPQIVVIADDRYYPDVQESLKNSGITVKSGIEGINESVKIPEVDMVLTAMVGYSGLLPTISAIKSGKTIALSNKETLVVAGELITTLAQKNNVKILPVDSEHSAIFQCLVGESHKSMNKILLTASGGPFRNLTKEELEKVTVEDALKHPNWNMGNKVTIDSASMMNKGFEMIEAKWLFNCEPDRIEILVHPQSIVHSMVEFCDGSIKAQIGIPDMHLPIQYAFSYPERLENNRYRLDWSKGLNLTFELPDYDKFPLLKEAFMAIEKGGNQPCILNAANEVAVKAFLDYKISFTAMSRLVKRVMEEVPFISHPTLAQLIETNTIARETAESWLTKNNNK